MMSPTTPFFVTGGGWPASSAARGVLRRAVALLWLLALVAVAAAPPPPEPPPVMPTPAQLQASAQLASSYLLANQTQQGDFAAEYHLTDHAYTAADDAVVQAATLWTLAALHRHQPGALTQLAVQNGLAYFVQRSRYIVGRGRWTVREQERFTHTATLALLVLTHEELLATTNPPLPRQSVLLFRDYLAQYLTSLVRLRGADGRWPRLHGLMEGQALGEPLPTTDGLCLLALLRAAQLPGGEPLRALAQQSALTMYEQYVTRPLAAAGPHPETLHFAGYGLLALAELHGTGWAETAGWAARVHELGQWLLASGALDDAREPRGDLLLGLAAATALATRTQDANALASLLPALDRQLARRCSWQVAGPLEGPYLAGLKNRDPIARGGLLVAPAQPLVSVEPTLHYLQALLIAGRLPRSTPP